MIIWCSLTTVRYDSVSEFVREFRLKERELIGTPYHPGGSAIIDFIKKLTCASVCRTMLQKSGGLMCNKSARELSSTSPVVGMS